MGAYEEWSKRAKELEERAKRTKQVLSGNSAPQFNPEDGWIVLDFSKLKVGDLVKSNELVYRRIHSHSNSLFNRIEHCPKKPKTVVSMDEWNNRGTSSNKYEAQQASKGCIYKITDKLQGVSAWILHSTNTNNPETIYVPWGVVRAYAVKRDKPPEPERFSLYVKKPKEKEVNPYHFSFDSYASHTATPSWLED